jgi:hypothetical protein
MATKQFRVSVKAAPPERRARTPGRSSIRAIRPAQRQHDDPRTAIAKVLALWPHELADESVDGRERILAKLRQALRAERRRGCPVIGPTTWRGTSSCCGSIGRNWQLPPAGRTSTVRSNILWQCRPQEASAERHAGWGPLVGGRPSLLVAARAQAHLLGKLRTGGGVVGCNHRVIVRQSPLFAVFLWREVVVGPQMSLQRLEFLAVL